MKIIFNKICKAGLTERSYCKLRDFAAWLTERYEQEIFEVNGKIIN